jgi:hypothetical protein
LYRHIVPAFSVNLCVLNVPSSPSLHDASMGLFGGHQRVVVCEGYAEVMTMMAQSTPP